MGNNLDITKSCMSTDNLCTLQYNAQLQNQDQFILKRNKTRSTQDIKKTILKYIQNNRLQLYPARQRKVLETLVSVEQQHISDKLIQMDRKVKHLQNQKRQLQRPKVNQPNNNSNQVKNQDQSQQKANKLKQITQQIKIMKQKRRKLFQDAQCLLLQDLDMIFQQIPKFDHNYEYLNSILSLSNSLLQKITKDKQNTNQTEPNTQSEKFSSLLATNASTMGRFFTQTKSQQNQSDTNHHFKTIHNHFSERKDKKLQQIIKQKLKIQDKRVLKKNIQVNKKGAQILKLNGLLMIVPIQCFSGIGALRVQQKTGLPSGASLLQVLMNKIKAVNMRRDCNLGVAFLVNEQYVDKFNEQIHKVEGIQSFISFQKMQVTSNLSNHQSQDNYHSPIQYNIISFKNIWPSFDADQKIILDQQKAQIIFSTHDGDLIAFIENSIELKLLIQKYRYVNITNINNLLSQIGDVSILGYLEQRQQVDIAVKVLKPKKEQINFKDYFCLDKQNFFNIKEILNQETDKISQNENEKSLSTDYHQNQSFLDIEEYYIKSRIFITQSGPLKRLLMSRISRKLNPQSHTNSIYFYLHRSVSSTFYSKFTAFIMVQQLYQFSHVKTSIEYFKPHVKKNAEIGYSLYCKKLLGLKQSQKGKQTQQLVEIDSGILHKGSQQIMKILKSLKKVKQIGFPMILYSDFFNNTKTDL